MNGKITLVSQVLQFRNLIRCPNTLGAFIISYLCGLSSDQTFEPIILTQGVILFIVTWDVHPFIYPLRFRADCLK